MTGESVPDERDMALAEMRSTLKCELFLRLTQTMVGQKNAVANLADGKRVCSIFVLFMFAGVIKVQIHSCILLDYSCGGQEARSRSQDRQCCNKTVNAVHGRTGTNWQNEVSSVSGR